MGGSSGKRRNRRTVRCWVWKDAWAAAVISTEKPTLTRTRVVGHMVNRDTMKYLCPEECRLLLGKEFSDQDEYAPRQVEIACEVLEATALEE